MNLVYFWEMEEGEGKKIFACKLFILNFGKAKKPKTFRKNI